MAIVEPSTPTSEGRRRLVVRSPATKEVVGEVVVQTAIDVANAVQRAKVAQSEWAKRSIVERARIVIGALEILVQRREEIVQTVMNETGKTRTEALMIEILPGCDFLNFWCNRAESDLRDEKRALHGYIWPVKKLLMHYKPLGVVGVITPWNGPFALSLNPTVQALLAGNSVLLKPSEVSPYSGAWAAKILHEAGVPEDVLQVLHGDGETGAALVKSDIQKISFTGSVATGKKIATECASRFIPCTLELGGKDAMIVCEDADLERAAAGAVFNSCMNSGHVCMGVERVYVMDSVADEFERLVHEKVSALRVGIGDEVDVGSVFWDRQLPVIERLIEDARRKGANIAVGGSSDTSSGFFYKPTLVTNVNHNMELMRDETFGPVVAVMRVRDVDQAIELANDSEYGLSGSVWTRNIERGIEIAKRLETGSVCINDASVMYGVPEAPFGGMKQSGIGQVNGLNALRSYTFAQPILIDRWGRKKEDVWYPHGPETVKIFDGIIRYVYGTVLHKWRFFS